MQKAIASVDSNGGGRAKRASPFAALVIAFSLLFYSPPPAKAADITDWFEIVDALQGVGAYGDFLQYMSQYQQYITAMNELVGYYDQAMSILNTLKGLENSLSLIKDYYAAYYKALAIVELKNALGTLLEGGEILQMLIEINNTIAEVRNIADTFRQSLEALNRIRDTILEIKRQIDEFIGTVRQLVDTFQAVRDLVNALIDFQNVGGLIGQLQNNTFLKKAMKDISNKQPGNIIPSFNFNVTGLTTSINTLVTGIDNLICSGGTSVPECLVDSPAWCASGHMASTTCIEGHPDYCASGYHDFEDVCTPNTWEWCNSGYNTCP